MMRLLGWIIWVLPQCVHDIILRITGYRMVHLIYMPGWRSVYRWTKDYPYIIPMEDIPDMSEVR
uniref:Uncharacterized protein n=1 Tax=viral metagenome TaxID=1070528 RepID=A0A6M3J9M3_9ZZZZ